MFKFISILSIAFILSLLISCDKINQKTKPEGAMNKSEIRNRIEVYAPTEIKADLSRLSDRQKKLIEKLVEAGKIADEIFWKQTSPDAIAVRDSLQKLNTPEAKEALEYVMINYGPYDRIEEGKRIIGTGTPKRPEVGTYYPVSLTKEEFESYIKAHPEQKQELESQYTVVQKDGDKLNAIPFHVAYPEAEKVAKLLDEASELSDDPTFKKYLKLRAKAIRTDDYFESDMAWMDLKDNDIDVIIGPVENYEDALFNYKTAYECVVYVKDIEGTKELQMFKQHINDFEQKLPSDAKYHRATVGAGEHILNIVNVVYFGGDCQKGIKTIACNLPNDPKVREAKGGKNNMFKNMMEAKFDKILLPIAQTILDPNLVQFVDKKAFVGFVTLHEISHTLGLDYVYGQKELSVRKAMKERFSAIEECKADILGIYNHKHLTESGVYTKEYLKKAMVTYIAGLYRSIRFGAEEAHGKANLIQLNFLTEQGVITLNKDGKLTINETIFFDKVAELAKIVLTIEAEGKYDEAGKLIEKYGKMTDALNKTVESLIKVPRDLNTTYSF
jgi:hypothetical protein